MPDPSIPEDKASPAQRNKSHPGPWWAVIWVGFYLVVTQIPGALLSALILGFGLWNDPAMAKRLEEIGVLDFCRPGSDRFADCRFRSGTNTIYYLWYSAFSTIFRPGLKKKIGLIRGKPGSIVAGMTLGLGLFFWRKGFLN